MQEAAISVACRMRPKTQAELASSSKPFYTIESNRKINIDSKVDQKTFCFDYIADDFVSQSDFFEQTGVSITQACLDGFNGTIIFYGQTGTGKTYSAFGDTDSAANISSGRGLVPRAMEYIFDKLTVNVEKNCGKQTFHAKCSFFEIYQEKVFDLLAEASNCNLEVREDPKIGVFVDGITEDSVSNLQEANFILQYGRKNRHVGQTDMNRDSSRSHAIFTLSLQISHETESKAIECKYSRFSFVDLAGSERQKDTHATGERLKEASLINKSLSTLGNVISSLTTAQSGHRTRYVCYRDSKLTFLLRDSLGGNTKTMFVATLSPSMVSLEETVSTLRFAQRVKTIRNVVTVNAETTGTVAVLQREIESLRQQLSLGTHMLPGALPATDRRPRLSELQPQAEDIEDEYVSDCDRLWSRLDGILERRGVTAIEQLLITDNNNVALAQRLEQAEKVNMGLKMKVKMRDSELQRLKAALKAEANCTAASTPVVERMITEEQLLAELASVREETKAEWIKYKLAYDEIVKRVSSEHCNSMSPTAEDAINNPVLIINRLVQPLWTVADEKAFGDSLTSQLAESLLVCEKFQSKFELLREAKHVELFGYSHEEGQVIKERLQLLESSNASLTKERDELLASKQIKSQQFEEALQALEYDVHQRVTSLSLTISEQKSEINSLFEANKLISQQKEEIEVTLSARIDEITSRNNQLLELTHRLTEAVYEADISLLTSQVLVDSLESITKDGIVAIADKDSMIKEQSTEIKKLHIKVELLANEAKQNAEIANSTIASLEQEMLVTKGDLSSSYQQVASLQLSLLEARAALDFTQNSLEDTKISVSQLKSEKEGIEFINAAQGRTIQNLEGKISHFTAENNELQYECKRLEVSCQDMSANILDKSREILSLESQRDQLAEHLQQSQKNVDSITQELVNLRGQLQNSANAITSREQDIYSLRTQLDRLIEVKSKLEHEFTKQESQLLAVKTSLTCSETAIARVEDQLTASTVRCTELEAALKLSHSKVGELEASIADAERGHVLVGQLLEHRLKESESSVRNLEEQLRLTLQKAQTELQEKEAVQTQATSLVESINYYTVMTESLSAQLAAEHVKLADVVQSKTVAVTDLYHLRIAVEEMNTNHEQKISVMTTDFEQRISQLQKSISVLNEQLLKEETEACAQKSAQEGEILAIKLQYKDQIAQLQETISKITDQLAVKQAALKTHDELQEQHQKVSEDLTAEKNILLAQLKSMTEVVVELEKEKKDAISKLSVSTRIVAELESKLKGAQEAFSETTSTYESIKLALSEKESECTEAKTQLNAIREIISTDKFGKITRSKSQICLVDLAKQVMDESKRRESELVQLSEHVSQLAQRAAAEQDLMMKLQVANDDLTRLQTKLVEIQEENSKLSGHSNSKQKIHHLVQLKKELEEQTNMAKVQRDRIVELTLERDCIKHELDAFKCNLNTVKFTKAERELTDHVAEENVESINGIENKIGILTRKQRRALQDMSNQCMDI